MGIEIYCIIINHVYRDIELGIVWTLLLRAVVRCQPVNTARGQIALCSMS